MYTYVYVFVRIHSCRLTPAIAYILLPIADVRADGTRLGRVLDGLLRHIVLPSDMSSFEAFMLAMFVRRHGADALALRKPEWIAAVELATNPRFVDWSFGKAVDMTHSHAMSNPTTPRIV